MKAVMLSVVLVLATTASASTYYISTTGSDAANGSQGSPWATIDHGADNAAAGDTVRVAGGTYREKVTPDADGTPGAPVVLWTDPADRAVINGADVVTGWTQCTPDDCPGNPEYASVYYKDMAAYPPAIFQDGEMLAIAGIPTDGWFRVESAPDDYHITDTAGLLGSDDQWAGVGVYVQYWTSNGHIINPDIIGYDSLTQTLALDPYWIDRRGDVMKAGNIYRIMNYLPSLRQEGRYCVDTTGVPGRIRVYVRPAGGGSPDDYSIEVPVRDAGIELRFVEDYVFHGFEIAYVSGHGISGEKAEKRVTVENMLIHHTLGAAVNVTENNGTSAGYRFRDCVMHDCADGILCTTVDSVTTERCHIFRNRRDGMKYTSSCDMVLRDSYIHHHVWRGHPDGTQFTDVTGFRVENTAIVLSGQTMMSAGCTDGTITNCLGIGAGARAWIGSGSGWTFRNNTAGLSEYAPYTASAAPCTLEKNIIYAAFSGDIIGTPTATSHNLGFMLDDDLTGPGDLNADPLFINAPRRMFTTDWDLLPEQRKDTLYLEIDAADFTDVTVGDHIEVSMDGIVRTVTARVTDPGFGIVIDPPLDTHPQINLYLFNWKEKTDFAADFRPAMGSPALGAGKDGADIGCGLDLPALNAADFDGDGLVDITGLPVGTSDIIRPGAVVHPDDAGAVLTVFPNPVRAAAVITASGPMEIYDASGHMVYRAVNVRTGRNLSLRWDGITMAGTPVDNGTYYVRSGAAVQRIMVVR